MGRELMFIWVSVSFGRYFGKGYADEGVPAGSPAAIVVVHVWKFGLSGLQRAAEGDVVLRWICCDGLGSTQCVVVMLLT